MRPAVGVPVTGQSQQSHDSDEFPDQACSQSKRRAETRRAFPPLSALKVLANR